MILAVGPGTPAAICWKSKSDGREDRDDDEDESDASFQHGEFMLQDSDQDDDAEVMSTSSEAEEEKDEDHEHENQIGEEDEGVESDNEIEDQQEHERGDSSRARRLAEQSQDAFRRSVQERSIIQILRRRMYEAAEAAQYSDDPESRAIRSRHRLREPQTQPQRKAWLPSIRHGGCINTACWLNVSDCPWRLATTIAPSPLAITSYESPTQIITSGDDRLIKFWDVSHAMGMASPLPGSWDTFCPLAFGTDPDIGSPEKHALWRDHYKQCEDFKVAGSVHLLASLSTGHRGNVFHVTPIGASPGKVLTCGADGYLRVSDLHSETSSVVVNPFDDNSDYEGSMAFSHQLLTANTGLLCSERGLHHFDLRVSPREQERRSLLTSQPPNASHSRYSSASCKACAVWSPHQSPNENTEPNFVFAGGANEYVELLDLRMDGSNKKVLQRYKPRCLSNSGNVSVSGLDVSKDGRELLVSYESDQIYTFPVFYEASSLAGPSLDEIDAASAKFVESHDEFLPELACYGGHLNRFTFLKNAKYAGPNDEYITTGSDSGKAWIYERKTGSVVSLLSTDTSTCNGVIPHPSLPFFITYGIDSTAKLWRAAPCVDPTVDDSPSARAKASLDVPYEMSPITKQWGGVEALMQRFDEERTVMPDLAATVEEMASCGRFASHASSAIRGSGSARFGNALRRLPYLLRQTRYECFRSALEGRTVPIEQPLEWLTVGVHLNRLRLQAARLGLRVNPSAPWIFEGTMDSKLDKADLVPDNASDWLLYDKHMTRTPLDVQMNFNLKDYGDVLRRAFPDNSAFFDCEGGENIKKVPWLTAEEQGIDDGADDPASQRTSLDGACSGSCAFKAKSRKLLFKTAVLLKEGGNQAVKQGLVHTAAYRYDKAIHYCAVAFMQYPEGMTRLKHLTEGHHAELTALKIRDQVRPRNAITVWSPMLLILIAARLNLALLLVKPEFAQPDRAADQARTVLQLLLPFAFKEGKVIVVLSQGSDKTERAISNEEPVATYREAKALQAKAYFRLGSAEFDMGDYLAAVKSFESSLKSSSVSSPNSKPDALLVRRLQEAKRKRQSIKKRARKQLQTFLADDADKR